MTFVAIKMTETHYLGSSVVVSMALLGVQGSTSLQPPGPEGLRDFAVKEKLRKLVYLGEAESGSQCNSVHSLVRGLEVGRGMWQFFTWWSVLLHWKQASDGGPLLLAVFGDSLSYCHQMLVFLSIRESLFH